MATSCTFEALPFGPVRFIGKKTVVAAGQTARDFVQAFLANGELEALNRLESRLSPDMDMAIWMGEYDAATKSFVEIPGVFCAAGAEVPEGYDFRDLPACTMGIGWISGPTRTLERGAHNKTVKQMKEAGYEPDYSFGYSMEYYSNEKYATKKEKGQLYTFGYYLPCLKIEG